MKRRTLRKWLPLAIVPLFSVAILTGCGSDDDDSGGSTPTPPAQTDASDSNDNGIADAFETISNPDAVDADGDGIIDTFDADVDGVLSGDDANENGVNDAFESAGDVDGNGIPDGFQSTDADADGDGIGDDFDADLTEGDDLDGNGVDDSFELGVVDPNADGGTDGDADGVVDGGDGDADGGDGDADGGDGDADGGDGDADGGDGDADGGDGDADGGSDGNVDSGGSDSACDQTISTGQIKSILFGVDGVCGVFVGEFQNNNLTGTVTLEGATGTSANLFSGLAAAANGTSIVVLESSSDTSFFIPSLSSAQSELINDNFRDGNLYVQVETNVGTLRGPIKADAVQVAFTQVLGENSVVPVDSLARGDGHVSVNTATGEFSAVLVINRNGVSDNISMAHIHLGAAGQVGEPVVTLVDQGGDVWAARGMLGADDLATMLDGGTYFNTHRSNDDPGFLRGQIGNFQ